MSVPHSELGKLAAGITGDPEARSAFPSGLTRGLVNALEKHQDRMHEAAEINRQALIEIAPSLGVFGERNSIELFALNSEVRILLGRDGQVLRQNIVDQGKSINVRPANDEEMRELFSGIVFVLREKVLG